MPLTLRITRQLAWPDSPPFHGGRLQVSLDPGGDWVLVEETDGRGAFWSLTLHHVAGGRGLAGDWMALDPHGGRALRLDGATTAVVALPSAETLATLPGPTGRLAFAADAAFAVTRPRAHAEVKAAHRPTLDVHALEGGAPRQLEGRFQLWELLPGGRLLCSDPLGHLTVWDLATGKPIVKGKGLGIRPLTLRVDRAGRRALVSVKDGRYQVVDTVTLAELHAGKSQIIAGPDSTFDDGRRLVDANVLLDVETGAVRSHDDGWLSGRRQGGREMTVRVGAWPQVAVLLQREVLGPSAIELWDVEAGALLGSLAIPGTPAALVALPGGGLLVAHRPVDLEEGDDPADYPALTLLEAVASAG